MKKFEVYRNIRKKAMIFGLPISLFALMMLSVIGSLLVIIFSFGLGVIVGVSIFNLTLYFFLLKVTADPHLFHFKKVFPTTISNKQTTNMDYGQD